MPSVQLSSEIPAPNSSSKQGWMLETLPGPWSAGGGENLDPSLKATWAHLSREGHSTWR